MRHILQVSRSALVIMLFAIALGMSGTYTNRAYAAPCEDANKTLLGIPTWYKYLDDEPPGGECNLSINSFEDALPIGLALLEALLTVGGVVAVGMVFIGGFKYVLSQGEPDKAAGGRKTVINAVIGLIITILATRIVAFVGSRLS